MKLRLAIVLLLIIFNQVAFLNKTIFATQIQEAQEMQEAEQTEQNKAPEIIAPSAVVIDAKTGIVIYDKNMHEKNYPASVTKIMTALLTIKNTKSLDDKVYFSRNAVFSLPYGTSHIAMNEDETLTTQQALYGLMLASANDVANALSEHVSQTTEQFCTEMTKAAKEIGAYNTNFTNPHGLHDENHYSTAFDMALIMKEAIKEPLFVKLISTKSYEIPPTEKQEQVRPLNNSNKMIFGGSQFYYEDVVGGKTGFTNEAMHTLVTYAKRGDIELIVSVLHDEKNKIYTDTAALLDYSFEQFKDIKVVDFKNIKKPEVKTLSGQSINAEFESSTDIIMNLPKVAQNNLTTKLNLRNVNLPVSKGDVVGNLEVFCGNIKINSLNIVSKENLADQNANVNVNQNIGQESNIVAEITEPTNEGKFEKAAVFSLKVMIYAGIFGIIALVLAVIFILKRNEKSYYSNPVYRYKYKTRKLQPGTGTRSNDDLV